MTLLQVLTSSGERNIRFKYYNNIVGDIELTKLEMPDSPEVGAGGTELKESLKVKFLNSYIMSLGPIELSSERKNSFLTFQIQFHYESFTTDE